MSWLIVTGHIYDTGSSPNFLVILSSAEYIYGTRAHFMFYIMHVKDSTEYLITEEISNNHGRLHKCPRKYKIIYTSNYCSIWVILRVQQEQTFPQEPLLDLRDSQQEIKDSNSYNKPKALWCVCWFFACLSVGIVLSFLWGRGRGDFPPRGQSRLFIESLFFILL